MMPNKQHIRSLVANVINQKYGSAKKDLQAVVDGMIKEKIRATNKKNLFSHE